MLRVSEALAKDVGRGIARIDPQDMAEMGAEVGDIIQIVGKRPAVAKIMPAYMEDRDQQSIQSYSSRPMLTQPKESCLPDCREQVRPCWPRRWPVAAG